VLNIEGVPTKHYLKEELTIYLSDFGLKVLSVDKVEYAWNTEFIEPPKWMNEPYPWDWLVICRKV